MVLRNVWPDADIPTLELSLNLRLSAREHLLLGRRLAPLRDEGVLVIGSGNVVHNLGDIDWDERASTAPWAEVFDEWVRAALEERRDDDLVDYLARGPEARRAHPTADHYVPLLYAVGLRRDDDPLTTIHMSFQHATISMRCVRFG